MNTVGILVQCKPQQREAIERQILALGCEVHLTTPEGKMVLTLEQALDSEIADTLVALQNIPGVFTASLVYHHYEAQQEDGE